MDILEIKVREMEAKLKLASNLRSPEKQYIYNGKENFKFYLNLFFLKSYLFLCCYLRKRLGKRLPPSRPRKWALKVVDHLFTKKELADHVIVVC